MNSFGTETNGVPSYSKPCIGCRKRKVKCDKTRPCSNCTRSKQLCTYESHDGSEGSARQTGDGSQSSDSDLRERLERLEKMMAAMMSASQGGGATGSPAASLNRTGTSPSGTPAKILSADTSSSPYPNAENAPVGQILFQEGHTAYFDSDFWPGLVNEIEDLRKLFGQVVDAGQTTEPISKWTSVSILGPASPFSPTDLSSAHPTVDESNMLCKLFFQSVNPFIRVVHEALFGREVERYRRGTLVTPSEFEALLFSIYVLTVNSLRPDIVESLFSTSKDSLLARFQHLAQVALANVDFFKTDKIHTIQALLHYLTFLFQQNLYKDAVALLGIASRLAQTMGLHRDPTHFPYSPWVCEIRRRIWNHISCLDALALNSYGAESCLPVTSDSRPPHNSNDNDWHASRFAKPSSIPQNTSGFRGMTFALAHRSIADMIRRLSHVDPIKFEEREEILRQTEMHLQETYLKNIDRTDPDQTVIAAFVEVKFSTLRLAMNHRRCISLGTQASPSGRGQLFIAAIELLEAIEYYTNAFASQNWGWVFETIIPFHAIAIILTRLPRADRQMDIDRAQRQISRNFGIYSRESQPVSRTPMWKLLVELRDNTQSGSESSHHGSNTTVIQSLGPQTNSEFTFSDDLMLDFNTTGVSSEQLMFDDQLILQDPQDLPWLNSQVSFSSQGQ